MPHKVIKNEQRATHIYLYSINDSIGKTATLRTALYTPSTLVYELMNVGIAKTRPIAGRTSVTTVIHMIVRKYFRVFSTDVYTRAICSSIFLSRASILGSIIHLSIAPPLCDIEKASRLSLAGLCGISPHRFTYFVLAATASSARRRISGPVMNAPFSGFFTSFVSASRLPLPVVVSSVEASMEPSFFT